MILTLFEFDLNSLCTGAAFGGLFDILGGCESLICVVDKSQSKITCGSGTRGLKSIRMSDFLSTWVMPTQFASYLSGCDV